MEMLGDRWDGSPDDLLDAIARAGYAGIEITDTVAADPARAVRINRETMRRFGL